MERLTSVEQAVFDEWKKDGLWVQNDTETIQNLRERLTSVAYHEAGHAVVNSFFGTNYTHFEKITIIPTSVFAGNFRQSRILNLYFSKWSKLEAIAFNLSGYLAQKRVDADIPSITEILIDWDWYAYESEEDWLLRSDEGKALSLAESIQNKIWPAGRILRMVEKWTDELLNDAIVWGVVEKLSKRLLSVGTINDLDELDFYTKPILFKCGISKIWQRRMKSNLAQGNSESG